jgi:aryl-alcohol dehydrogenase-like predicted oxidoreductase
VQYRPFGRLGKVSALTLGGGGIGGVRGATDRAEAVATVHAAIAGGVVMLDVAPGDGPDGAAETLVGEALRTCGSPEVRDVMITTRIAPSDDEPGDVVERMVRSLHLSLDRLGRDHVDLLLVNSPLCPPTGSAPAPRTLGWATYVDQVVPTILALREELLIRGWGLTGLGDPALVLAALNTEPRPDAVQVTVDALETSDDTWISGHRRRTHDHEAVRAAAPGVSTMALPTIATGTHTDSLDRVVHPRGWGHAAQRRTDAFRALAADLDVSGVSPAHRYALTVPGIATVVLNVKNRAELNEWLEAERRGPLTDTEMDAVRRLRRSRRG